jgi:hypothetical protein
MKMIFHIYYRCTAYLLLEMLFEKILSIITHHPFYNLCSQSQNRNRIADSNIIINLFKSFFNPLLILF